MYEAYDVRIRPATAVDAPRIHELHLASVRTLCASWYAPAIIEGWLSGRSPQRYLQGIAAGAVFVAESDATIIGFCEGVTGEVRAVFVDPAWTGRGVGKALLLRALQLAATEPLSPVRLEASLNAVAFYERHGFHEVARSTVRRNTVDVPVVIMEMLRATT